MQHLHPTRTILAFASVALAAGGCASNKTELPPAAVNGLLQIRDSLVDNKAQVQKTANTVRDLVDHPRQDVTAQIGDFRSALRGLTGQAMQTRQLGAGMQMRADTYFAQWDEQLKSIGGELGSSARERREASMASFAKLEDRVKALRGAFKPFMNELEEAEQLLQADPTVSAVKAATPALRKTLDRESEVLKRADDVIAQIDAVRGGR